MGFRPYLTITPNFLEYAIEISKTVNFIGIICCFDTGPAFVTIPEIIPSKESLILLKEFKTGFKRINRKYLYDYKKE